MRDEEKVISDEDIFQFVYDEKSASDKVTASRETSEKKDDIFGDIEAVTVAAKKEKNRAIFNELNEREENAQLNNRNITEGMSRNGRRTWKKNNKEFAGISSGNRRDRKHSDNRRRPVNKLFLGNVVFFPLMIIYLEFVFHLIMDKGLSKYTFIYILFAIPAGLLFSFLTLWFNETANKIITYVLTVLICLLFAAEYVIVIIFQLYTPIFSMFDMAGQIAGEGNFVIIAVETVLQRFFVILLFFVPTVFIFTIGRKFFEFRKRKLAFNGFVLGCAVALHVLALTVIKLPWGTGMGVYTPKELYNMDTAISEQVNKLGVFTMLRLDLKYMLFPVDPVVSDDVDVDLPLTPPTNSTENPGESTEPDTEPPVVIDRSPNIMDIDFDALIGSESNKNIVTIHKYVSQKNDDGTYTWATNKNEYTGMFEGYNVIFLTAEGFSKYGLIPELMPTLYRLSTEGFVFNNFYTPLHFTSTIGGEFQNITGLYPKDGQKSSIVTGKNKSNLYFTLARQLNRDGYTSLAYHNGSDPEYYDRHISHPNFGYEWRPAGRWFELEKKASGSIYWPQSDLYMVDKTINDYLETVSPFNIYYLTVSGHVRYNFTGNAMSIRNKEAVAELPYSDTVKAYIACQLELEKAVTKIVEELERTGLDKKTLLVLAPDHIPYFNVKDILSELAGQDFGKDNMEYVGQESGLDLDVYKNTLIMWSGSMEEPVIVDKVCCQVDILPTVSNLLGLEFDSRLIIGSDIMSDSIGLVVMASKSWISDVGSYNIQNKKFTLAEGLDPNVYTDEYLSTYISAMTKIAKKKIEMSTAIIDTNYYASIPLLN